MHRSGKKGNRKIRKEEGRKEREREKGKAKIRRTHPRRRMEINVVIKKTKKTTE